MQIEQMLNKLSNSQIEFATMRAKNASALSLERSVVVTGPPEMVELTHSGDARVLARLVARLSNPTQAWAAEVLLAAMTGHEADIVNSFAHDPDSWWETLGKRAQKRWERWLAEGKDRLEWDEEQQMFVEKEEA